MKLTEDQCEEIDWMLKDIAADASSATGQDNTQKIEHQLEQIEETLRLLRAYIENVKRNQP